MTDALVIAGAAVVALPMIVFMLCSVKRYELASRASHGEDGRGREGERQG